MCIRASYRRYSTRYRTPLCSRVQDEFILYTLVYDIYIRRVHHVNRYELTPRMLLSVHGCVFVNAHMYNGGKVSKARLSRERRTLNRGESETILQLDSARLWLRVSLQVKDSVFVWENTRNPDFLWILFWNASSWNWDLRNALSASLWTYVLIDITVKRVTSNAIGWSTKCELSRFSVKLQCF